MPKPSSPAEVFVKKRFRGMNRTSMSAHGITNAAIKPLFHHPRPTATPSNRKFLQSGRSGVVHPRVRMHTVSPQAAKPVKSMMGYP